MPTAKAVLIDIPDVPFTSSLAQIMLDEELYREDTRWERRFGLANQQRSQKRSYSSGLLCLATVLKKAGFQASYLDYRQVPTAAGRKLLAVADYLMVSCISPFFPILSKVAVELARIAGSRPLIIGGFGPSYEPEKFLKVCPPGSVAVLREGETAVLSAIEYLNDRHLRPGLAAWQAGCLQAESLPRLLDANQIPVPDYSALGDVENFRINISTMRGCPGACLFCSGVGFWPKIRCRTEGAVIAELDCLDAALPKGTLVHFCDNVITWDRPRFLRLARAMAERHYGIHFSCDVRGDAIDPESAAALELAGFRRVCLGVEDCEDRILTGGRKGLSFFHNICALQLLRQNSTAYLTAYWMIGLPGSTAESLKHNLAAIAELVASKLVDQIALSVFKPYPGCRVVEGQLTVEGSWEDYLQDMEYPIFRLSGLSAAELADAVTKYKTTLLRAYRGRI